MKAKVKGKTEHQIEVMESIKKADNTSMMKSLTAEDQQKVLDFIFSGGKGENPMEALRKKH